MTTWFVSDYGDVRQHVGDGDVVAVRGRDTPLALATSVLFRSPYTHTATALWLDGGLFVAEMWREGMVCVPLSQYRGDEFDVFPCPVERAPVREHILLHAREGVTYDFMDLLRIGVSRLFGLRRPAAEDDKMVCSSLTAHALFEAGWRPPGLPAVVAPPEIVEALGVPPAVSYRPYPPA